MKIIGLTGGIACGKSTVAGMLQAEGAWIVDADEISRSLTQPGGAGLPLIREAFGDQVFAGDTLDRAALSRIVFSDKAKRETLNGLLHPLIHQEMLRQMEQGRESGAKLVILDIPLLFEANMQHLAQAVACVYAPQDVQIERMKARNGYTREEALRRIQSQMPLEEKMRLSDVLIPTDKPLDQLRHDVHALYHRWTNA